MAGSRARVTSALLVCCALVVSCGPAREASPPRPELVAAEPPPTTTAADHDLDGTNGANGANGSNGESTSGVMSPALAAAGRDEPTAAHDPGADPSTVSTPDPTVATPTPTTPATTAPALTGWEAFDDSLRRSIVLNGSPAASVAVLINGVPVRASAFGERVHGTGEPAEPATRFRVASISKIITSVIVLQLVQEGRIGLDQPVGGLLADALGIEAGPGVVDITPEQLLSHTSGFPQYGSQFFGDGAAGCPDVARWGLARAVGPPGHYQYSNMNYCVAGLLVEILLGQTYEAAAAERLLGPLGITGMRLAGTYDAMPGDAGHFSRPGRAYMEALGGAGAWIATATDVALILDSLDPATPGWSPLAPELLARMRRPPTPPPPPPSPSIDGSSPGSAPDAPPTTAAPSQSSSYGLGLILYPDGSVGHTGTLESTHAMVLNRPDGVTWAVLVNGEHPSNSGDIRRLVDRAFAAAFPDG